MNNGRLLCGEAAAVIGIAKEGHRLSSASEEDGFVRREHLARGFRRVWDFIGSKQAGAAVLHRRKGRRKHFTPSRVSDAFGRAQTRGAQGAPSQNDGCITSPQSA